jgi:hypothetical protein
MEARMGMRLVAKVAAGALLLLVAAAAPLGSAVVEPVAQEPAAESPTVNQRSYHGPGLRAFKVGHRAWELHDWKTAISSMSQALKADPDQPEAQVRLPGVFVSPYIPKYYQSHAQCQLGNCREARAEMDDVLKLIKDAPSYLRNRYQKDCLKACPRPTP